MLRGGRIQANGRSTPESREILIADDGRIAALPGPGESVPSVPSIDLDGKLVVPGLVDAHQHLDKSHTSPDVPNPQGTLEGAIAAFGQYAARMTHEEIAAHADRLAPRGLTRVNELARAGVTVACASDNIRDPFVPTGSGDLLEIARWTLLSAHMGSGDLGRAFDMVTGNPARLLGIDREHGLAIGARADLLVTQASDAADLVAGGSLARAVVSGGSLVAGGL